MTAEQLQWIETALGIKLPADYKSRMLEYEFHPDSHAADCLLWDDPQTIIDANRETADIVASVEPFPTLPAVPFQIGCDGGEQMYYLDAHEEDSPVYVYDFELRSITVHVANLAAWIEECRTCEIELEEDRKQMARIAENKRWWQFWI